MKLPTPAPVVFHDCLVWVHTHACPHNTFVPPPTLPHPHTPISSVGADYSALTFQHVRLTDGGLEVSSFQGPGIEATNITLGLDAGYANPAGYFFPDHADLPGAKPLQPPWVAPVVAVCATLGFLLLVASGYLFWQHRRRGRGHGGSSGQWHDKPVGSYPLDGAAPGGSASGVGSCVHPSERSCLAASVPGSDHSCLQQSAEGSAALSSRESGLSGPPSGTGTGVGRSKPVTPHPEVKLQFEVGPQPEISASMAMGGAMGGSVERGTMESLSCIVMMPTGQEEAAAGAPAAAEGQPGLRTAAGLLGSTQTGQQQHQQAGGGAGAQQQQQHAAGLDQRIFVAVLPPVSQSPAQADVLHDSVASGMQRWRAAVSSTTMLLMERRMDAAGVGAAPTHSGGVCGSSGVVGRQGSDVSDEAAAAATPAQQTAAAAGGGGAAYRVAAPPPPQLQLGELLGTGSFGSVYIGTWRGKKVAVKVMQLPANALFEPQLGGEGDRYQAAGRGVGGAGGVDGREQQMRRRARQVQQNSPPHMALMEAVLSSTMSHPNGKL